MNDHELEAVRMRMGMVYQDAALLSSLTVRENLALPLQELTNKTPAEIDKVVDEKLEMVGNDRRGQTAALRAKRRDAKARRAR
jgi:phospholipid/cholesterol/gamma-HCH transport system ATP-binding protein